MRRFPFLLLLLPLFALSAGAQKAAAPEAAIPITLGQSAAVLNGPWKFHIGDNPQWSQPGFDDSGWQETTIDPKHPTLTAVQAIQSKELPGWQSHGHPAYTGYAWYRIGLPIPPDANSLALMMPQYVDDDYEVYVNGQKIGGFGRLDGWRISYVGQPELFSIPDTAFNGGHTITVALRFWSQRDEALPSEYNRDGGLRGVPLLGPSELLQVFFQSAQQHAAHAAPTRWRLEVLTAACSAVSFICFFLFLFSRRQREYLWAGVSLIGFAGVTAATAIEYALQTSIPFQLAFTFGFIAYCASIFALPLAAMYLLSVTKPLWRRINYAVFALMAGSALVGVGLVLGLLPPTAAVNRIEGMPQSFYLLFILLLLAISVDGLRTIGRKAWLLLTPGVFFALYLILFVVLPSSERFVALEDIVFICIPLSVLIIFLLRFTQQQRENARLVDDMKQAQEVQQILIPEKLSQVSGFRLEAVYRPAQQVGGDFFQILPLDDGGLLVIVGDVSGKGTRAAMLVAVIVGAVRTIARDTATPGEVLTRLNTELLGRMQGGFATCLIVRIAADGALTLANAGHLGPYINGVEIEVPHNLPLGLVAGQQYEVRTAILPVGGTLVLMTDGVVEAQSAHGELYGFDRTQKISREPAEKIVATAQAFGQQDDITVVSVERVREADAAGA